jgi:hypothetical protein
MPRGIIIKNDDPVYEQLKVQLRAEWEQPTPSTDAHVIIEAEDSLRPQQAPTNLYVIWNAWQNLSQKQRSEMLLDVYSDVKGISAARNVTLAMGLTPAEASRLGINYSVVQ